MNNIDLIKYAKCGLLTIIKSNLQKKISIKLLEDLSKMIESTGSENIIMGGDTEDELNQSFNVVSLGDSNVGNKQNIEMNRESESYCTTAFGKITHSGNERVSKPEAISTISPGKISWAKIVGFPVIPWKKADVKYDAETDKAGHGIHNLESEPFTKAEESCVINSGILSLSPEDIVGKLEFNACYNMAIQYAVPTADRVKSLLYGNETIYFMLLAGLRYTKARTKDKHDQQQLAREWLHILLSDNLIGNLGGLVGRKKCESIFVHCTRRLLDEAYDLIRADSSKKKYHDFLSNNAALIKATLRDLMYIAKSGFEQNKTYDYLINGINTLLGDMASKAIHMGGQSAGEERQSLAVVLLDDGNGKDKSDKEWISENERSCTTAPGKHHSGNEPASKSEEVSTILPDIKTWAQMVKPPVIPKKNKVDVKYDADHVIHNLKIEPLTEAQERVIHHAIRGKPMALSVPVMSENSPGPKNWSQMVKLPVIPEKNKEGVKYDANHGICNLKIEPLTEAQEKVIHHAIPDKPMVLPVTIALENQNHTVDQNKRLSVQPDCLKKDLLDQDIEATDELMGSAIKRENTSPDNQGKYRLKKKTDPVKKYLKSVEGSSIRSPSALNVIRNGSYCDAVYKSFQNRYKETFDKAVIFLPQLVTELLKDKPIDKKSSIVNLVYKLIFLYVEKATDRIVSFDSGGHPEHKEDVFLDLDPIRNVHSYLLGKGMLVSEEDKQGFESIVKDIQEIECRCRSFVIDRLNKLYSEKSPDLQEICRTVRAGLFLDVINKDYARRMLDNSDYLNQIDQTLDLLQALTLQRLFQQNLSTDDAHNVTDILEFATKFDDRLSGPALSKNENSGHENLPSDIDETLCFKVFRGHLITCLRSYTSRANNDVVSSEKQKTRLDSKGEEIKRIADSPEMKKISEKITDSVSLYRKPRSRSVIIEYSQILKDLEGLKRLCSDCKSSYWADQFYTSLYCSYVLNLVDHTVFVRRSRHSLSNCVCYHKLLKLCIEQFNKMDMNGFFSEEQCSRMDKLLIRVFSATAFALKIYNKSCVESSNLDELILYNSYQVNNLERLGTNLFENIHEIEKSQFSNQALSDKSSECVKLYNACSEGIRKDIALRTTRCTEHSPHEEHRSLLDITTVVSRTKSGVI
nr:hypothetical protein [Endozoicomonas sp.]